MLGRCRSPNRDPPSACSVWEAWPYWRCGGALANWIADPARLLGTSARRALREIVWRTCKVIALLDKTNAFKEVDLGLVYSSAASAIVGLVMDRLRQDGDLE